VHLTFIECRGPLEGLAIVVNGRHNDPNGRETTQERIKGEGEHTVQKVVEIRAGDTIIDKKTMMVKLTTAQTAEAAVFAARENPFAAGVAEIGARRA
jgi:hypothetical protein